MFSFGLRAKLFVAVLPVFAIPVVGLGYVREMEALLKQQQEQNLITAARTIATALHDRPSLLRLRPQDPALKKDRQEAINAFGGEGAAAGGATAVAQNGVASGGAAVAGDASVASDGAATDAPVVVSPITRPVQVPMTVLAPDPPPATDEVSRIISGLNRAKSRIWVLDKKHQLLALAGSLKAAPDTDKTVDTKPAPPSFWERAENLLLRPLYSRLLTLPTEDFDDALPEDAITNGAEVESALSGIPATRRRATLDNRAVILSAAHPIWADDDVVAAVVVEETTNAVQSFTTRALEKLITGTLLTFLLASVTVLAFASRIAGRISRLRNEAEAAIDANGRVRKIVAGSRARDEIGDLSRSYSQLLERLAQYHDYLEQLGSRLSHEFRTPIAVVRSSLENLQMQGLPEESAVYVQRAEQGISRLSAMLSRMSEARRIEAALREGERVDYDPREVVQGSVEGYRAAYPGSVFRTAPDAGEMRISGSPELLAQGLDKLVANAVSFTAEGSPIGIALRQEDAFAVIEVENTGPLLPQAHSARLFDSMVSLRDSQAGAEPHLGLGLFIVRLVAEFHNGSADARNRPDGTGVIMRLRLPLKLGAA
ncbi:MAG: histidine kinase [Betaproteobacteria bacterium]|nr:histidine kinase [Betaproteobacteria bacterium]